MSAVDDLITWLRAQLDEDERVARAITAPEWNEGCSWLADLRDPLPSQRRAYGLPKEWQLLTEADTKHIARWDPDRVLAEIDAKRRILDEHQSTRYGECDRCREPGLDRNQTAPCLTVRLLAQPYAAQPGFRDGWRLDAG